MLRIFFTILVFSIFGCSEDVKPKKLEKKGTGDLRQNDRIEPSDNLIDDDLGPKDGNKDDDAEDNDEDDNSRRWKDASGNEWVVLSKKMNWCAANGIDIKKHDEEGLALPDLANPDTKVGVEDIKTLLGNIKGSGIMTCIKDEGRDSKAGTVEGGAIGGLLSNFLGGGNSANPLATITDLLAGGGAGILGELGGAQDKLGVGANGKGCREALGKGWRMPTLDEVEDVDAKKLIKAISRVEDREFWTSTTVESSGPATNTPGGIDLAALIGKDIQLPQGIELGALPQGPIGAFTYEFDNEGEATAGKQAARSVICIRD